MFGCDNFVRITTFFIQLSISPGGREGFDNQVVVVGNAQDPVHGLIKYCIHVFAQHNWDGYDYSIVADRELHRVGFLVDEVGLREQL